MGGSIFLRRGNELVEMRETPYELEDVLQRLLAEHPNLLAGEQVDASNPRRWLLVAREMGVPSKEQGSAQWSLDHLFLDQDGIPTLVEVKRGTDTRIRREVVGQLLDYAANGVAYWPVEEIKAKWEAGCADDPPEEVLDRFLQSEDTPEHFWENVKTNLQAGKVRMVFVADVIPPELLRVVQFLNEQMDPAEVLALEVRQFVGEGRRRSFRGWLASKSSQVQQRRRFGMSRHSSIGCRPRAPQPSQWRERFMSGQERKCRSIGEEGTGSVPSRLFCHGIVRGISSSGLTPPAVWRCSSAPLRPSLPLASRDFFRTCGKS